MKITKPTLLINKSICEENIKRIYNKANQSNTELIPHYKTHQSIETGKIYLKTGINKITVSSVSMAQKFANSSYKEITIAFPLNFAEIDEINSLAENNNIVITLESKEAAEFTVENIKQKISFIIEIDTGYNRTGIWFENENAISEILEIASKNKLLNFFGFMIHDGLVYNTKSVSEIEEIHQNTKSKLIKLKQKFNTKISMGDSASASLVSDFSGIDILRPGNFVYYDLMQQKLGSCNYENIALTVACPVVSIHKERNEVIIYGGVVHFSKEFLIDEKGNKFFGIPVIYDSEFKNFKIIENAYVKALSQEHGIIKIESEEIDNIKHGQIIGILPIHACLTADLLLDSSIYI
jgi:D-serine deaminase-like pyridoxal phosphate-dependent protein